MKDDIKDIASCYVDTAKDCEDDINIDELRMTLIDNGRSQETTEAVIAEVERQAKEAGVEIVKTVRK